MKSILDSNSNSEAQSILRQIGRCGEMPGMFGSPDNILCASMHLAHVFQLIREPFWDFSKTQDWWNNLYKQNHIKLNQEAIAQYRWSKWGNEKERAYEQVVRGMTNIWSAVKGDSNNSPLTNEWLDYLLSHPTIEAYPDNLEVALFCLLTVATNHEKHSLGSLYRKEKANIAENMPSRSLVDVGSAEEWQARSKDRPHDFEDYSLINQFLTNIVYLLKGMPSVGLGGG